MPRKSSKKTAASTASVAASSSLGSGIQSPLCTSTPIVGQRPSSPLSPTRYSRLQEKQNLHSAVSQRSSGITGDVLHREGAPVGVRKLSADPGGADSAELQTTHQTVTREVTNIEAMYEHELKRDLDRFDEMVKYYRLKNANQRLRDENEDLKSRLDKKTKDLQISEQNVMKFETRCNDLQSQSQKQSQAERKKLAEKEREWEKEESRLKALLDDVRKRLEEETLQRIDLENNIQSLKEDISFKDKVHQQEISETRARQQVEISEIEGHLRKQHDADLQELRDRKAVQVRIDRDDMKLLYEKKLKELISHANHAKRKSRARIRDLEKELTCMQDKMAKQLQEYEDFMDIKVAFNLEFAEYKDRMNTRMQSTNTLLSTSRTAPSRHTPLRNGKRKRTLLEESKERSSNDYSVTGTAGLSLNDIKITQSDPLGRFVKLTNKGSKEISLDGLLIIQNRIRTKVGSLATIFKVHREKLDAGANVMVWLAVGAHESSNIVMKDQKWSIAHSVTTKVTNIEGEEMATPKCKRQQLSSTIILT